MKTLCNKYRYCVYFTEKKKNGTTIMVLNNLPKVTQLVRRRAYLLNKYLLKLCLGVKFNPQNHIPIYIHSFIPLTFI